jgi:hypothetical protein
MFKIRNGSVFTGLAITFMFAAIQVCHAAEKSGEIQGTVTIQGKPLAEGKITFHFENGQFAGSPIKDGKYKVDLISTGKYRIAVEGKGVPAKYLSADTSGLAVEVKNGKNAYDIILAP